MSADKMRARVAEARIGRLATVGSDGGPHVVPVVYALEGDAVFTPVDHKPKRTTNLQRLRNIAAKPQVALLVDSYDEDWTRLWWVRIDGLARVMQRGEAGHAEAAVALERKYGQYEQNPITGPIIAIAIERWSGWSSR
jgi:PPOX class probable F420-dependent enzyme